ncbi:hypothetical protein KASHIRA_01660 [Serratia phage vB_SmaM-Kashira]|nr:hypothetical protein [Acinetobacter phage ABPH49]URC22740.1 hypothetical protein KASHIRA_01660 [Serratia phage vB_SmaM-Kashira]
MLEDGSVVAGSPGDKEDPEEVIEVKECRGCGKFGEVNFDGYGIQQYYCGGSPNCCP